MRYHRLKIVFHQPISTTGLTLADIPALKARVAALLAGDFLPEGAVKARPQHLARTQLSCRCNAAAAIRQFLISYTYQLIIP